MEGGPHGGVGVAPLGNGTRQCRWLSSSLVQVPWSELVGIWVDWVLAATTAAMNTPNGPASQPPTYSPTSMSLSASITAPTNGQNKALVISQQNSWRPLELWSTWMS